MKWPELMQELERRERAHTPAREAWLDRIQRSQEPGPERRARRRAEEWRLRSVIDQACRAYAASGAWPLMDEQATLHAWDRWRYALGFARWLDELAPGEEREQVEWLEWLLIECWAEHGVWRLHAGPPPA